MAYRALIRPDGSVFEYPIPGVDTAIKELRPGCSFQLLNSTFVEWNDPEGREPPTGAEITAEVQKVYPTAIVMYFNPSMRDPTQPMLFAGQET